jgi:hypothetical protein
VQVSSGAVIVHFLQGESLMKSLRKLHELHEKHENLWWILLCVAAAVGLLIFAGTVAGW